MRPAMNMMRANHQSETSARESQDRAEYRTASPKAQYLSDITGFVAQDIDVISRFCASKRLLIVSRCPNIYAKKYIKEVKSGEFQMKPGYIRKKTGSYGILRWGGRGYVSDYDLMCVHRLGEKLGTYVALDMTWDGKGTMSLIEQEIIGSLNKQLVFKIQHGCNDSYVRRWADGSKPEPKVKDIGDEFIVFRNNEAWHVTGKFNLRTKVYDRYGLSGWHAAYGC